MPSTLPSLWVVATPLGNPGDLSPRAKSVLESVDFVLAEDTRRAGLLCRQCGITVRRFVSCHDHNEDARLHATLASLREGQTAALISDAGTPLVADPGFLMVRACHKEGLRVSMLPGPCAPIAALSAAGIAPQPFTFFGFLPRDAHAQEQTLAPFARIQTTLVFFERKDRLHATLATLAHILGRRDLAIARELTKEHEEFIIMRLEEHETLRTELLGEITVIIGPPEETLAIPKEEALEILRQEQQQGGKPKDIVKRAQVQCLGWTAKALYTLLTECTSFEASDTRRES